jgi:hypothetical protein
MGRFDILTQLETKSTENILVQKKPANPQEGKPVSPQKGLPANPQDCNVANNLDALPESEKPEKYTTRLKPSMVKRVKVFAAQQDIKDYEVVEKARREYLEKSK